MNDKEEHYDSNICVPDVSSSAIVSVHQQEGASCLVEDLLLMIKYSR